MSNLQTEIKLVFINPEGQKLIRTTTLANVLEKTLDELHEELEPPCTESSCNTESQNFCDCGPEYQDYSIHEVTGIPIGSDEKSWTMERFMNRISPSTKKLDFWERWDNVTSMAASYQMGMELAAKKYEYIQRSEQS